MKKQLKAYGKKAHKNAWDQSEKSMKQAGDASFNFALIIVINILYYLIWWPLKKGWEKIRS